MKIETFLLMTMLTMLVGCDSKPKVAPLSQPPQIIQDQKQALDDTKSVGDSLEKQAAEQRKKLEEETK
ncbi:MAG: hypothetical protein WC100_04065 [Sterolibacterium sp.]